MSIYLLIYLLSQESSTSLDDHYVVLSSSRTTEGEQSWFLPVLGSQSGQVTGEEVSYDPAPQG
jgi:hypothetical protein